MEGDEEDKDKSKEREKEKEKEKEKEARPKAAGDGDGDGEDDGAEEPDNDDNEESGDQMASALHSIALALTQMQDAMKSMESKMNKTDKAVRGVARRLKVQGAAVKSIDRRVKALEYKGSCPTLTASSSAVQSTTSSNPIPRPTARTRPSFIVRSLSTTAHHTPPNSCRAPCDDSFTVLGKNLLKASQNGRTKQVRDLLDAGADINFTCGSEWTPLHRAAAKAHDGVVALLLERGANVKARNGYGFTALHIAAYHDFSSQCVTLLIEAGSDVNSKNRSGRTPLHYAAESGNVAAVRALLNAGAKMATKDDEGRTPYSVAKTVRVRRILRTASTTGNKAHSYVHLSKYKFNRLPSTPTLHD